MHDLTIFTRNDIAKPTWSPKIEGELHHIPKYFGLNGVYVIPAVSKLDCYKLRKEMDNQKLYPVGVDGYAASSDKIGSYRAMAWSTQLADKITRILKNKLPNFENVEGELVSPDWKSIIQSPFEDEDRYLYTLLGSTPWLRCMRYSSNGKHVPHYDASFHNVEEKYRTLFSWVLYLSTADERQGGRFQFIDDTNYTDREKRTDWARMADEKEIIDSIRPEAGTLLVFPHWYCHQVEEFIANKQNPHRYIIRGDVAYGY